MAGLITRLLAFTRTTRHGVKVSDAKVDLGGGAPVEAEHAASPGEDAYPLKDDYALALKINRAGGCVIVGYVDPNNTQKANAGDKRIYARNNAGDEVVELWLKNDGSTVLTNSVGSFELQADGDVVINGVTIDTLGNITTPVNINAANVAASATMNAATMVASTSLTVEGTEMKGHRHGGVQTGSGTSGGPQ